MRFYKIILTAVCLLSINLAHAQVLPQAVVGIKIPLAKKPTSRPMGVAFVPYVSRYYIADGGLQPVPGDTDIMYSRSLVHIYDDKGAYITSILPGYDSRSIYFNPVKHQLELVTYNISSNAGFAPNTGIFTLPLTDKGDWNQTSDELMGVNPAFGDAGTMPSYDPETNHYFAKQERSNRVFVVDPTKREKIGEITLDLDAAGAKFDDVSDHYVAFTGVKGEELALLDVDHKAVLVFDLNGKLVGKSMLPQDLKLHSQNHFTGLGYANGMMFVYHEPEGEFGTYYGFKVLD